MFIQVTTGQEISNTAQICPMGAEKEMGGREGGVDKSHEEKQKKVVLIPHHEGDISLSKFSIHVC